VKMLAGRRKGMFVGCVLLVACALFVSLWVGLVLVPGLSTRSVIERYMLPSDAPPTEVPLPGSEYDPAAETAIVELGGASRAIERLKFFRRMPSFLAPEKHRRRALGILQHCGKEVLPMILTEMDSEDDSTRAQIVRNCRYEGVARALITPVVSRGLVDGSIVVRESAAEIIHTVSLPEPLDTDVLVRAVSLGPSTVRVVCCYELLRVKSDTAPRGAITALRKALNEEQDWFALTDICCLLAHYGADSASACEEVAPLLAHRDGIIRTNALTALSRMGDPWAPKPCYRPLATYRFLPLPTTVLRGSIGFGGGGMQIPGQWRREFGSGDSILAALPALRKALAHPDSDTRSHVLAVIGGIGKKAASALPDVSQLLASKNLEVRANAVWAAWVISGKCPEATLKSLLSAQDKTAQSDAVRLMYLLPRSSTALEQLMQLGARSKFSGVREDIAVLRAALDKIKKAEQEKQAKDKQPVETPVKPE